VIDFLEKVLRNKFFHNVAIVVSGTAGAQAITMAFTPALTRLYGPEIFGAVGAFVAILEVLIPLTALSFPLAIVLPKNEADAHGLAKLSLIISFAISSLASIILVFFGRAIAVAFNLDEIYKLLWLLPPSMLFASLMATTNQFAIRKKLFPLRSRASIAQALITNISKCIAGVISPSATALTATTSLGYLLNSALIWPSIRATPDQKQEKSSTWLLFIKYYDFAVFRTPQVLINSIGQNLPILMLSILSGPASVGHFILARTVLFVPSTLIGQSIADVFYPKFVESIRAGEDAKSLLLKTCLSLSVLGFALYAIPITIGPWIFSLIFGSEWREAGELSQWMSLWLFSILISRPVISAIPALSLQKSFLIFELGSLFTKILLVFAGYKATNNAIGAIAYFSIGNFVIYILLTIYTISKSPNGAKNSLLALIEEPRVSSQKRNPY
jgi:O-antigen/teichoic acid export membrane protein